MASTFNCPACGVTLDNPGSGGTIPCPYCNATITIPEEPQQPWVGDGDSEDAEQVPAFGEGWDLRQAEALQEFISLVNAGNDFEAIVNYQKVTGCDLAEAEEAVRSVRLGHPIQRGQVSHQAYPPRRTGPAIPPEQVAEMKRLLQMDRKIEAIKIYRKYTACGLKEARNAVEALARGEQLPQPKGGPGVKKGKGCPASCLFNLLMVGVLLSTILMLAYSSLPEELRAAIGDYASRFTGGYGYVSLRIDKQGDEPGMLRALRLATADGGCAIR